MAKTQLDVAKSEQEIAKTERDMMSHKIHQLGHIETGIEKCDAENGHRIYKNIQFTSVYDVTPLVYLGVTTLQPDRRSQDLTPYYSVELMHVNTSNFRMNYITDNIDSLTVSWVSYPQIDEN